MLKFSHIKKIKQYDIYYQIDSCIDMLMKLGYSRKVGQFFYSTLASVLL